MRKTITKEYEKGKTKRKIDGRLKEKEQCKMMRPYCKKIMLSLLSSYIVAYCCTKSWDLWRYFIVFLSVGLHPARRSVNFMTTTARVLQHCIAYTIQCTL